MTLLEAMASGTSVVASKVGGNGEIIEHGKNGFLLSLEERREWLATIGLLSKNPEMRRKVADAGKRTVEKRFSLERMNDEYEKVYQGAFRRAVTKE